MRRATTTWEADSGRRTFTLYINEQAPNLARSVVSSNYDTFISHKGSDMRLAEDAGNILYERGVRGYLDRWDPSVDGDTPELEEHLREVIRETPSILAVVTEHTSTSWWVPFELGVARETDSHIATYLVVDETSGRTVELPSYLRTWPILASESELQAWANTFETSRNITGGTRTTLFENVIRKSADHLGRNRIDLLEASGKVIFV